VEIGIGGFKCWKGEMPSGFTRSAFFGKKGVYYGLTIALFAIISFRLFYLQIYHRQDYLLLSERNRVRRVTLEPLRGMIFDRQGRLLVGNKPAFSLSVIPYELKQSKGLIDRLARILKMDPEEIWRIVRTKSNGPFVPVRIKRHLDLTYVCNVEENRLELPGVQFEIEPRRSYPSPARASHLLGYIGEISREEYKKLGSEEYSLGDFVGKAGVEKRYERYLRGEKGYEFVEVDAYGRIIRPVSEKQRVKPRPGANLYLTIDAEIQARAESLMDTLRGAIILADVRNGEILCLVSKPDYDPAIFSGIVTPELWKSLQEDPTTPLYNRAVQSLYPPGSTFKLVLAAAALETGKIRPEDLLHCPGYYPIGYRFFKCWREKGHGTLNLYQAIEQSCNVYFYQLGLRVGVNPWAEFARRLGFGRKTGIDLDQESEGLVPDEQYLDRKYGAGRWTKGLILNLAVGQGDLQVTPLQMLQYTMIFATKGRYARLHVLRRIEDPTTGEITEPPVDSLQVEGISQETFEIIREGMRRVVNGEKGTGRLAQLPGIEVAGKTGTAQNPHGNDHAWFIGFAPYESPRVAICVLVENGGFGGAVAAPIARQILQFYFQLYPI